MDIALNDGRGAFVSGDAGLLAILFRNVIDNAVRYSAPGAKVDVGMEAMASDVRVTVRIRAPAFPPSSARTSVVGSIGLPGTQAPGSGLGLSIVQRIPRPASRHDPARHAGSEQLAYWSRLLYRVLRDEGD